MNYKVNFDSLDALYYGIQNQASLWNEELEAVQTSLDTLKTSKNISGAGADNIKEYFNSVHGAILASIVEIISAHMNNALLYKQDYQTNIDTELHAVIISTELSDIITDLDSYRVAAQTVADAVSTSLSTISDIFPLTLNNADYIHGANIAVRNFVKNLDEEICALEDRHDGSDFTDIGNAIDSLKRLITDQTAQLRSYKESFTIEKLAGSESFVQLYQQVSVLDEKQRSQSAMLDQAIENENSRVADLQKEYEERLEREEDMKVVKWIVTGVCVVGSIAAIAFTGGAATPLVVGAVSAVSGAVMAGANTVADQYAASGDLSETNWGEVGKNTLIGGVTGFVTGYVGAGISGAVTSGLSQTAAGATLLNSSNALVRIGTGAVIGSVSEVSSGIVSRGASTLIVTGDVDQALDQAFNLENIVFDAAIGGASGGLQHIKAPKKEWSDEIMEHIASDEQLEIYENADLTENTVNGRKSLTKDIDYDYIDDKTGLTNRELMAKGRSPYDAKTGEKIELHHMGQEYDAPFAELCENSEHGDGNHSTLHPKSEGSWRNDKTLNNSYLKEKKTYWIERSKWGS